MYICLDISAASTHSILVRKIPMKSSTCHLSLHVSYKSLRVTKIIISEISIFCSIIIIFLGHPFFVIRVCNAFQSQTQEYFEDQVLYKNLWMDLYLSRNSLSLPTLINLSTVTPLRYSYSTSEPILGRYLFFEFSYSSSPFLKCIVYLKFFNNMKCPYFWP